MRKLPLKRWQLMGYEPNEWALDHLHSREERFRALVTARQVGKTTADSYEVDMAMSSGRDYMGRPPRVGVLAPTYQKASLIIRMYEEQIVKTYGRVYRTNYNEHRLWYPEDRDNGGAATPGAELQWLSADDPMSVVGFTFGPLLVIDESQSVPDIVIEKIWPTLDVRMADVIATGTPDVDSTQTWFRNMWVRGQDELEENYYSHTVKASDNPHMSLEAIIEAQQTLSDREFRRLYEGEWVDAGGSVFLSFAASLLAEEPPYEPEHRFAMSVDLAISEDFNVIMVGDRDTKSVIHMERWNQTDPIATYNRCEDIWERYGKPEVVADNTGIGKAMVPELKERGMRVTPITISPANKIIMIRELAEDLEHGRIRFYPYGPLIRELKAFVYESTPSGRLTANAIAGYNDDCVWSLILLNQILRRRGSPRRKQELSYLDARAGLGRPSNSRLIPVHRSLSDITGF